MEGYFGTDGIRGIANEFLTGELASRAGNAVAQLRERPLILVGRDTRISGDMLALAFSSGAIGGGGDGLRSRRHSHGGRRLLYAPAERRFRRGDQRFAQSSRV